MNQGLLGILHTIGANEELTQQELAQPLELTRANVSQLVTSLGAMNLVERRPVARAYTLWLMDSARVLLMQVVPEQRRLIDKQFWSLRDDQMRLLRDLMLQLAPNSG